uniref:Ras-associating domain-containing protein n=1 Tax=Periophthalmus magnuspinnatus TaxID=409849 RepID=A0A3B3ZSZ1_9GOBI
MELQVCVEGSLRVVCGGSLSTTCQEVVIALAQDLGQTGRYVLTLNLHGSERQLLKDECPLQELSNLGRESADALLILRRTGPSTSSLPTQKTKHRPRTQSLPFNSVQSCVSFLHFFPTTCSLTVYVKTHPQ